MIPRTMLVRQPSEAEAVPRDKGMWEPVAQFLRENYIHHEGFIAFSPGGRTLAIHGRGSSVELIDPLKMQLVEYISMHRDDVTW